MTVIERRNARSLDAGRAALRAGPDRGRRVVHLAHEGAARRARLRGAGASTAWRWSSRSSRSGRERVGKGGVVRSAADRRAALVAVAEHARATTWRGGARASRPPGLPGPAGNRESFVWLAEAGRARAPSRPGGRGAEGRAVNAAASITVFTHAAPGRHRRGALRRWSSSPREAGVEVRLPRRRGREARPGARRARAGRRPGRRHRPRGGARRRRHDPVHAARASRAAGAGVRDQLRRDRLPRHGRARELEEGIGARWRASST